MEENKSTLDTLLIEIANAFNSLDGVGEGRSGLGFDLAMRKE